MTTTTPAWQAIKIDSLRALRMALKLKYGNYTTAASELDIPYYRLSNTVHGRDNTVAFAIKLQSDLDLSDAQVLALWPLLRRWPRPELEERALQRAG